MPTIYNDEKNNTLHRASYIKVGEGLIVEEDDTGLPVLTAYSSEIQAFADGIIPDECIPINATYGWLFELTNQPLAKTYYPTFMRPWYDASKYNAARLVADIYASGASTAVLELEYSLTPSDDNSWVSASSGDYPVVLSLAASGTIRRDWEPLASGALADAAWRVVAVSGDGALSPVVGLVAIEFTKQTFEQPELVNLYFREDASDYVLPEDELGDTVYHSVPACTFNFWGDGGNPPLPLPSPDEDDVFDNPYSLSLTKGTGLNFSRAYLCHTGAGLPHGESTIARFISPPLATQRIEPFTGQVAVAFDCKNGSGAAFVWAGVHIHRPTSYVFPVWSAQCACDQGDWARYQPRERLLEYRLRNVINVQAGDRLVVDVGITVDYIGLVLLNTGGSLYFDGDDDSLVEGDFSNNRTAAYISIPEYVTFL